MPHTNSQDLFSDQKILPRVIPTALDGSCSLLKGEYSEVPTLSKTLEVVSRQEDLNCMRARFFTSQIPPQHQQATHHSREILSMQHNSHLKHQVPALDVAGQKRRVAREAGVVDEHVDAAVLGVDALKHADHVVLLRDVTMETRHLLLAALRLQLRSQLLVTRKEHPHEVQHLAESWSQNTAV